MKYKGYTARIEFDDRDEIFVGRVLGLRAVISFHGRTVAALRREFRLAVDAFLEDCRRRGLEPERPSSGRVLLRLPADVHGAALVAAQASGKSLNQWACEALQRALRSS